MVGHVPYLHLVRTHPFPLRLNPLQRQFFFAYAVMGCLVPFLPIYLKQVQGLDGGQIGLALGISGISVLVSPVLMTLLADTRFDARHLAALIFAVGGAALLLLFFSHGFWVVLILLFIHSLAYAGALPLHDGMAFSLQRQAETAGWPAIPYHRIRVWGTIGFIGPSLLLFFLLQAGGSTSLILLCGAGFSILAFGHAFRLPNVRLAPETRLAGAQIPTAMAAKLLLRPHMRIFCLAMFIFFLGASAFSSFYPLYLIEVVGVEEQWVGLIFNFGVVIEIGFLLSLGWLQARLGVRKIMIYGTLCFILQMLILGLYPNVGMAIVAQSLHGMIILALYISPIIYLNRQSGDPFRNSIQGLYTMLIVGLSRIIGIVAAGQVADANLRLLPFIAAALALITWLLFLFAFRDQEPNA